MRGVLSACGRVRGRAGSRGGLTLAGVFLLLMLFPGSGFALPDNRGYELVSPVNALSPNVDQPSSIYTGESSTERLFRAASDGHAVAYPSDPIEESGGDGAIGEGFGGNETLAEKSSAGAWTTKDIEPAPGFNKELPNYQWFSSDLSMGVVTRKAPTPLTPEAPAGYAVLYERNMATESYAPLFTVLPPNRTKGEFGVSYEVFTGQATRTPLFAGASANYEHMLFEANDALTPEAQDGGEGEYDNLYDSVNGQLRLVNVLPNDTTEANATFGGFQDASERGSNYGAPGPFLHDISEDGSRIFWTDLNTDNLYVRIDGTRTVQVDASVGGGGRFRTASPDGSKVFFTKAGDLYEYRVDTEQTIDLTPGGEVQGVVGTSEDDSYIYFVAGGALAAGASPQECATSTLANSCNLYVLHEGEPARFIAKISARDDTITGPGLNQVNGDWRPSPGDTEAEVTPDGQHLVFASYAEITGYKLENSENIPAVARAEVYLYDFADGGTVTCISCNPSGEPPTHALGSAYLAPSFSATFAHRWISEDGTRVFFVSLDPLVPGDTNGSADVYEWERDGAGECQTSGGCLYALSGGTNSEGSFFADASASGDDVFIVTRAQLVSQDKAGNIDIYDVRVDASKQSAAPECSDPFCAESGGNVASPPASMAPSSVTFSGFGNVAPVQGKAEVKPKPKHKRASCKKGSRRRKGRCVKIKAKSKKARRSARGSK